ncbi:unnamed protein product [Pieris brassicae]|uniref:Uncharacterized protein n=1 Tax=Pieris brassicae TaxID=7116 RepID=A0A9P0XAB1_PIEBR|nr:unnamed protein product [Pieris brassicae]
MTTPTNHSLESRSGWLEQATGVTLSDAASATDSFSYFPDTAVSAAICTGYLAIRRHQPATFITPALSMTR